ncbi:MAG: hypothetical protein U5M51_12985 [Emticicia sp.]|nr:hypothetical protein [Emticicia sp.]
MNILLISALLLGGCKANDPIATPMPTADYSIVDGDTIKTVIFKDYKKLKDKDPNGKNYITVGDTIVLYKEPKLHTPPAKDPDLSKLKNNDDPDLKGKPLRYVAIGGSLTAGVRDGSYFNEGILTSYPNLIARQMKLKKFEQPLFDATDYNGFGRKVRTSFNPTGGPVPKFNEVKNNSGVESVDEKGVKLKKYNGNTLNIDNLGLPYFKLRDLDINAEGNSKIFDDRIGGVRKILNDNKLYWESNKKTNIKFDFFSIELLDDVLNSTLNGWVGGEFSTTRPTLVHPVEDLLKRFSSAKLKGVIFNIPNIADFPYFNLLTKQQLINGYTGNSLPVTEPLSSDIMVFPSSKMDSAISEKVNIALKPNLSKVIFISKSELSKSVDYHNLFISKWAKENNFPVVDLNSLFKRIFSDSYITDDGIKIDKSYVNGNFFSKDALYPTPLGQAIIANEVIKTLNSHYKLEIPLISTKEYLNR